MAKLFTHHDRYHVHKILGLLVLLHYIYRFALLYRCGDAFPPPNMESPHWASSAGVILHGLLSWSSLLLPLPTKRNFNAPMVSHVGRPHTWQYIIASMLTHSLTHLFWNLLIAITCLLPFLPSPADMAGISAAQHHLRHAARRRHTRNYKRLVARRAQLSAAWSGPRGGGGGRRPGGIHHHRPIRMPAPAHDQLHAVSHNSSGRSATRHQEELCIGAVRGHGGMSAARCHRQLCPVVGDSDGTPPHDAGAQGQGYRRDVPSGVRRQSVAGLRHGVCEIVGWGWAGGDQDCGPQDHLYVELSEQQIATACIGHGVVDGQCHSVGGDISIAVGG